MGKDNITFHSQIWPAELLAYAGKGDRGGEPGEYGVLNLPTEVVSSEYLTMGDKQFSSSRGHVLYVGDFLARYGPDALRYFICAAGPETSDAAFTWADFVTRNNSELVAGWGNLVNRTATMIAKSFGEIPARGELEPVDEDVLAAVQRGFETVGDLIGRHRLRGAIAEAMRVVGEVNKYLTVTEPYKMKDESQRERLGTVLHVAAQCVLDCNTLLSPFLPHSSNKVWAAYGGKGEFMPMPRIDHVEDLDPDDGAGLGVYPIITGDYSATPAWERRPVVAGTPVAKPTPIFTKLDPAVVDEELARLADADLTRSDPDRLRDRPPRRRRAARTGVPAARSRRRPRRQADPGDQQAGRVQPGHERVLGGAQQCRVGVAEAHRDRDGVLGLLELAVRHRGERALRQPGAEHRGEQRPDDGDAQGGAQLAGGVVHGRPDAGTGRWEDEHDRLGRRAWRSAPCPGPSGPSARRSWWRTACRRRPSRSRPSPRRTSPARS